MRVMQEHPGALDYDCMTRTGRTLAEFADMGAQGRVALCSLLRYLGPDSMTWREMHGGDELPAWSSRQSTNAILADIYDALAALNNNVVRAHSKRKPRPPKPYPRPNAKRGAGGIGTADVSAADFDEWWRSGE